MRLDLYISSTGKAVSRVKAAYYIKNGDVTVNGIKVTKSSFDVSDKDIVRVNDSIGFVGKGGLKLKGALDVFDVNMNGLTVIDVGASTGGFTDCCLKYGAKKVYSVDVGHGQLASSLLTDKRVVSKEGVNILDENPEDYADADIAVMDVSFTSVKNIIPRLKEFFTDDFRLITLIKPQFEIGKKHIKNGIVRDKKDHIGVLDDFCDFIRYNGLVLSGLDYSPITGGDGNIEFIAYITDKGESKVYDLKTIVENAHRELRKR